MTSLYVDRRGVVLQSDGEALVFCENGERVGTVPIAPLSRIFLRGEVTLTSTLLGKLGQAGIGVVILSGRKAQPTLMMAKPHNDAARRISQYRLSQDDEFCLSYARSLVAAKIAAQVNFLDSRRESYLSARYPLARAVRQLGAMLRHVGEKDSIAQLRGLEGAAANVYFSALSEIAPESLHFSGRNRRPPRDPLNAVLSLAYTMMHAEAVLAAYGAGLDPYIGFFHGIDFGRESLASDLIEPFRPEADGFALKLFNRQELRAEHFSTGSEGCFLGKAGREAFYRHYEAFSEPVRKMLDEALKDLLMRIEQSQPPTP
jgi:CRISPR-associated protein Cas1